MLDIIQRHPSIRPARTSLTSDALACAAVRLCSGVTLWVGRRQRRKLESIQRALAEGCSAEKLAYVVGGDAGSSGRG